MYRGETSEYDVSNNETVRDLKVKVTAKDHLLSTYHSVHLQQNGVELSDDTILAKSGTFDICKALQLYRRWANV